MIPLLNKLISGQTLSQQEWETIISNNDEVAWDYAQKMAQQTAQRHYGNSIFVRALIEITNICKNNCYYCGIRAGNKQVDRYRLSKEEILACCEKGANIGFKTFVLQGGEDLFFTIEKMVDIVKAIRNRFPEHAITLSLGEMSKDDYQALYDAGANRYLLRHETANETHYSQLHPKNMLLSTRKQALWDLKEIGFQTGSGFMVGSPHQTVQTLAQDMMFLAELQPEMVGIGPFLPHDQTPFKNEEKGCLTLTTRMLTLTRLLLPKVLLPATTAVGTLNVGGRSRAIEAGANVVMPNVSPPQVREKYSLYNNKLATGVESLEGLNLLIDELNQIHYQIDFSRGDAVS